MKTYMSEKQLSMVGRVWEIRRYLKMAQRKLEKDTSLLTYLAEQTDHNQPHMQHHHFVQNNRNQHIIPFPMWK